MSYVGSSFTRKSRLIVGLEGVKGVPLVAVGFRGLVVVLGGGLVTVIHFTLSLQLYWFS